jgi:hypothetical protein
MMDKLIKENIERIKSLMIESEGKTEYNFCDRFLGNKQKMYVCSKIGSLKGLLSRNDGLDLRTVIEKQISDLQTEIPQDLQDKFIDCAIFLESLGKITEKEKNNFIEKKVKNGKLVYLNGEWQPINKLNTNYFDLAEILTELIYKNKNNTTFQAIINDPKTTLMNMKSEIHTMIEEYFDDPKMLFDYTKNIQRTTQQGESAEQRVKEHLQDKGFKVEYEGGNGDLIDMAFGTDLIMSHPDFGVKTIQVKANEKAYDQDYRYVDWVIIATPFTIYNNKTKKPIQL